ncbi:MAG: hypothetical protein M3Y54_01290, partial [Bacteroidota bacterium]|nr:hypothetical protein [Bacteroidota bacterium]
MQTTTFTPKLLRQQSFFRFLLPLFAIFLGMGASQSVLAQTTNTDNLTITSNPTGAGATITTYDGTPPDLNATNPLFNG